MIYSQSSHTNRINAWFIYLHLVDFWVIYLNYMDHPKDQPLCLFDWTFRAWSSQSSHIEIQILFTIIHNLSLPDYPVIFRIPGVNLFLAPHLVGKYTKSLATLIAPPISQVSERPSHEKSGCHHAFQQHTLRQTMHVLVMAILSAWRIIPGLGYVVHHHGDRKYPKDRIVGPKWPFMAYK